MTNRPHQASRRRSSTKQAVDCSASTRNTKKPHVLEQLRYARAGTTTNEGWPRTEGGSRTSAGPLSARPCHGGTPHQPKDLDGTRHSGEVAPKQDGGTARRFRALQHFSATTLISNDAVPKDVHRALRHKTLQLTLESYIWWRPRHERHRRVLADADHPDSLEPTRRSGPELGLSILAVAAPQVRLVLVEPRGLEPLTPALQRRCSAS